MTKSAKKILSWVLKAAILVLAAWFIYHKFLTKNNDLQQFRTMVVNLDNTKVIITLSAVAGLMLVNWFLEALKWQFVTRKLVEVTKWEAIESVFCGLTWAIITPNRVGEYGGRIMFLPNRKRIHGLFAMIVGGLGQNLVTNVLGLIGALWFIYNFKMQYINMLYFACIVVFVLAFLFLVTLFYFNIGLMVRLLKKVTFIKKYSKFFGIMDRYSTAELLTIFWYSLIRFMVFTLQYYLLIHLVLPQLSMFVIAMMIFTFLIIQSALPSLDIFDIGVRSFTAATLFASVTDQQIAVVVCVSLIWLINLVIPAIIGCFFVFKLKFFDRYA